MNTIPLLSQKEVKNLKLSSIPLDNLRALCNLVGINDRGNATELIKKLINVSDNVIDNFIKTQYKKRILERQNLISDDELKQEIQKVREFSWGVVQGQLDQKIQVEYVRKIFRYNDLISKVKEKLHDDITFYVICTWYNHWTTVLIEEHIAQHPKVIPTLKPIKGIDIFFDGQPFDLKITYLPREYPINEAIRNPKDLAIWMYENQGPQRFGADNRLFVVVVDTKNPEDSWKLKRDFPLILKEIDEFFNSSSVTRNDEIIFSFNKKTYTTVAKVLLITK